MAGKTYYVKSDEREKGPYPIAALRASLREGSLNRATLVRADGAGDWVRLDTIIKPEKPEFDTSDQAATVALRAEAEERARMDSARKQRDVLVGAFICLLGIVVTLLSYSSASGGGRYVIAWGAIVFGAIRLVRGLSR